MFGEASSEYLRSEKICGALISTRIKGWTRNLTSIWYLFYFTHPLMCVITKQIWKKLCSEGRFLKNHFVISNFVKKMSQDSFLIFVLIWQQGHRDLLTCLLDQVLVQADVWPTKLHDVWSTTIHGWWKWTIREWWTWTIRTLECWQLTKWRTKWPSIWVRRCSVGPRPTPHQLMKIAEGLSPFHRPQLMMKLWKRYQREISSLLGTITVYENSAPGLVCRVLNWEG